MYTPKVGRRIALSIALFTSLFISPMAIGGESRLGIDRAHYGVWDRTSFLNIEDYPFTTGQSFSEEWTNMHIERGVYDWTWLDDALQYAYEQGHKCYIKIQPVNGGISHPEWLSDEGVPTFSDGVNIYGDYLDPEFQEIFAEMVMAFGDYVRNGVPEHLQGVVAWVRVESGRSGDEVPFTDHDNVPAEYQISDEEWKAYKLWVYGLYDQAFQEGEGYVVPLLFNAVQPEKNPDMWAWCVENVTGGLGSKYGGTVRGHHLTTSATVSRSFKHLAEDNDMGLFSRNEMDGTWANPFFQTNIKLNMYWTAVEQLHAGMSVWDVTGGCLTRTYEDEHAFAFEFFDKWAAELIPETAGGGFCILHEGLDSADKVKFPEAEYGSAGQGNESRYVAIVADYAAQGAKLDDPGGATKGQLNQRQTQTGLNDAGWGIVAGNYDRFITQIDPDNTSIGLWRIGGGTTADLHPYSRFARGFENASGKNTMYFDVKDNLVDEPGQSIQLSVIYYDEGTGQFALKYDAKGDSTKTALTVTKADTRTWKTASAIVTDALLGNNGPNGADLMLVNVDSEDDVFHMVELLKLCDVNIGATGRGTVKAVHGLNAFDLSLDQHMEGYELDLTAVPEQGWELTSWSGDASGTDESFKLFPTADTRVSANFSYTGRFYSEDDFNTADLAGGVGWAGDWVLNNLMEYLTNPANTRIRLYANSQLTRTLAVPVSNAVLEFKRDLDKLDNNDGDALRAEVYDGAWHTVWEVDDASENGDNKALWQESIDLGAYGSISMIRFTTEIESGESLWLDNVRIVGYNGSASDAQCYFTADPISAPNGSDAAPYTGSMANDAADPDSDPLIFTKLSGPAWLSVASDGSLSGAPTSAHAGLNTFTVQVQDDDGIDQATLLVLVDETNAAPVFAADPIIKPDVMVSVAYGDTLRGLAYDPNLSDSLIFSKVDGADWLSLAPDGSLTGIPSSSDAGLNTFTVRATDAFGVSTETVLEITVLSYTPNGTLVLNPTDDSWVNVNQEIATNGSNSYLQVDSSPNRETFLKFMLNDVPGQITSTTLRMYSVDVDQTVHCKAVSDTSWDEETLSYANRPSMGSTIVSPVVVPTTWNAFNVSSYVTNDGVYAFGLQATSGKGDFESKEGVNRPELVINYTNTAPVFSQSSFSKPDAGVNQVYSGTFSTDASDAENDALSFSKVAGPDWLTIASDGTFTGVPKQSDLGENSFVVQVDDPGGVSDSATFIIDVLNLPNAAPFFTADEITKADAGFVYAYSASLANDATDIDIGDTLTFRKLSGPAWLSVAPDGALSGAPLAEDVGLNLFTIEVADDGAPSLSDTTTLQITVLTPSTIRTLTLGPAADTWVSSSETKLDANYGDHPQLRVGKDAARESFLKFSLNDVDGPISSATLRLYSIDVAQTIYCNELSDSWEEGIVTYNNRPVMGDRIDTVEVASDTWNAFDVTSYATAGGQTYGFGLEGTGGNKNFHSREGTHPPELVVVFESPVPAFNANPIETANAYAGQSYSGTLAASVIYSGQGALTYSKVSGPAWLTVAPDGSLSGTPSISDAGNNEFQVQVEDDGSPVFTDTTLLQIAVLTYVPGGTVSLNPTHDTWVTESKLNANYGSHDSLRVGKDAARESFLMFDVNGVGGPVYSAKLRLYSKDVAQTVHCNSVVDTDWIESDVNYENRPAMGESIDSVFTVEGEWNEFDVASYVTQPGAYAFGLEGTAGNDDFSSKEGEYAPELIVEYRGGFINVDQDADEQTSFYEVTNGSNAMLPTASSAGGTGSGRDVLAVQGADGVLVEFVAYDVAADGTIQLVLLGADGQPIWDGSVNVIAGSRAYARLIVPGLELGADYDFIVRDETGTWWDASEVTVSPFVTEMLSTSNTETTLSFKSLPDHDYEIQWVELLGDSWMPLDTVTATEEQTLVIIPHPDPEDTTGFFRVELK